MTETNQGKMLEELMDREKIRDCLQRYSIGIDRCDVDMLNSTYWPDAVDNHGYTFNSRAEFVDFVIPALKKMVRTQHFMGNSLIRLEGNFAKVETYTQNWHTMRDHVGRLVDVVHGGRYLDKFEKRGSEWRVIDRLVIVDWLTENRDSVDIKQGFVGVPHVVHGERAPDDSLYTFLGGLTTEGYLDHR